MIASEDNHPADLIDRSVAVIGLLGSLIANADESIELSVNDIFGLKVIFELVEKDLKNVSANL